MTALGQAEDARVCLNGVLPEQGRLRQYFTSAPLARLMASMMTYGQREIRILDPGAGVGALCAACVERICAAGANRRPERVSIAACEIDGALLGRLAESLEAARRQCHAAGIDFEYRLENRDFVSGRAGANRERDGGFTHVIMNPPYGKIGAGSAMYRAVRGMGLSPVTNKYAAFIAVACRMMRAGGQLVFISPRSFCNGAYFCGFRRDLLESVRLKRIHLFGLRTSSFRDDSVLQENVIVSAVKRDGSGGRSGAVTVSYSSGPEAKATARRVNTSEVVRAGDPQRFIHISPSGQGAAGRMDEIKCTLSDLGLGVSTGKIIDFRARASLRAGPGGGRATVVPLVRPYNISLGRLGSVKFPAAHKHHNFVAANSKTRGMMVYNGSYVLVKRFTTVEEARRVVAAVWTRDDWDSELVGFENRVNYFHAGGGPLMHLTALGLAAFLNSTLVDEYFRQFNGNTQVNATDLRYLRYPTHVQLARMGRRCRRKAPAAQRDIDSVVDGVLESGRAGCRNPEENPRGHRGAAPARTRAGTAERPVSSHAAGAAGPGGRRSVVRGRQPACGNNPHDGVFSAKLRQKIRAQ